MTQHKTENAKKTSFKNKDEVVKIYAVSYDSMPDSVYELLPQNIRDELETMYTEIKVSSTKAHLHIPRLKKLIALYPEQPENRKLFDGSVFKNKAP